MEGTKPLSITPRPQFTLRALLVAMLVVAAFFADIRFERERQRREEAESSLTPDKPAMTIISKCPAANEAVAAVGYAFSVVFISLSKGRAIC